MTVSVGLGVCDGVNVGVRVWVAVGVRLAVGVGLGVCEGVDVGVRVWVAVGVGV